MNRPSASTRIADEIHADDSGHISLRLLHRRVDSVVTMVGSFDTDPDLAGREDLVQDILVELLDKGTRTRDRFELARIIEDRGASINFASQPLGVYFVVRCLKDDTDEMLALVAEQLAEPALAPEEFDKAKRQLASHIQRGLHSTTARASAALTGALFAPGHPNHDAGPEQDLEALGRITLADVNRVHSRHFKGRNLVVCAAGDLDPKRIERSAISAFAPLVERIEDAAESDHFDRLVRSPASSRIDTHIADRNNLDVLMGSAVDLRRDHPEFVALHLGNFALGGNFSARLMTYVREERGLTYGTNSHLAGFDRRFSGYWQIGVTLSREKLDEGLEATRETVERFVTGGITGDELQKKQQTIDGLFKVGLATTRGLADAMHGHFRNGFPPSYIDDYPEIVKGLTVSEVNAAIRNYLDAGSLVTSVAGSVHL